MREVCIFIVEAKSDKVMFIWLSFTGVRAKRNGKAGGHLDCKTMGNVCQVTERVTRICKKANNCCLWRQLNPNHCWGVWTMRWNFALEVIWNVPDKKIPIMYFLWTMVSYHNWRTLVSHSCSSVRCVLRDPPLHWGWCWAISKKISCRTAKTAGKRSYKRRRGKKIEQLLSTKQVLCLTVKNSCASNCTPRKFIHNLRVSITFHTPENCLTPIPSKKWWSALYWSVYMVVWLVQCFTLNWLYERL